MIKLGKMTSAGITAIKVGAISVMSPASSAIGSTAVQTPVANNVKTIASTVLFVMSSLSEEMKHLGRPIYAGTCVAKVDAMKSVTNHAVDVMIRKAAQKPVIKNAKTTVISARSAIVRESNEMKKVGETIHAGTCVAKVDAMKSVTSHVRIAMNSSDVLRLAVLTARPTAKPVLTVTKKRIVENKRTLTMIVVGINAFKATAMRSAMSPAKNVMRWKDVLKPVVKNAKINVKTVVNVTMKE